MPRKRRSHPAELKAKIALEALRGEAMMVEVAADGPASCAVGTVKLTRLWADEASWPDVKRPLRKGIGVFGLRVSRQFRVNLTVPTLALLGPDLHVIPMPEITSRAITSFWKP